MIPDKELQAAYEVFVDGNGIINLVSLIAIRERESNTRLAELIFQDVLEILDRDPTEYDMIVNLLPIGKDGYASSKARKIYLQISSHKQTKKIRSSGRKRVCQDHGRLFDPCGRQRRTDEMVFRKGRGH